MAVDRVEPVAAPAVARRAGRPAPLGNILVASDFEEDAGWALDRALQLCRRDGASLEVFHVLPTPHDDADAAQLATAAGQRLAQARRAAASSLCGRGADDGLLFVALARGAAYAQIADRAHHGHAELIVVGRHGERTFGELLIGSTAERVVRTGSTSVLVVAGPPTAPYRRPLVALDGSASARLALELAARLCAGSADAELDVVHVIPPAHAPIGGDLPLAPTAPREVARRLRAEVGAWLAELGVDVAWRLDVVEGDPRAQILAAARARGSDLVAVGTHGRTGLRRALLGSVAEAVIRGAATDVLVARLPAAS
ncbi:MAG: universal stress protein [Myxococcales bacterium]|nr:universal stress protein [Myxococcales bacterium]